MLDPIVVVVAVQNGLSHGPKPEYEEYRFKEGEFGLLNWKYASDSHLAPNSDIMEPWVTWDNDPQRIPRVTMFCQIVPRGLEKENCRVLGDFAKTR